MIFKETRVSVLIVDDDFHICEVIKAMNACEIRRKKNGTLQ